MPFWKAGVSGAAEALGERAIGQRTDERVGQTLYVLRVDEQTLLSVVHEIEDGQRPMDRSNLDALAEAMH